MASNPRRLARAGATRGATGHFPGVFTVDTLLLTKALPVLAVLYVIPPIDVLPDVLPALGQIDDLALILIALAAFLRLCPAPAVAFHRAAIDQGRVLAHAHGRRRDRRGVALRIVMITLVMITH